MHISDKGNALAAPGKDCNTMAINGDTSLQELAVIVSTALEEAGITAVLSGGGAVSIFSDNAYESADLDFVTSEGKKSLQKVLQDLGFTASSGSRMFEHPDTDWYVEFPPGPLGFGDTQIDVDEIPLFNTKYGQLRIITPTLSIIDRLAAFWYHFDRQTWDQAIEVAKRQTIDWDYVYQWAKSEKQSLDKIKELQELSK